MKKKSFLSGIGAKLALAAVALTTVVFTSCEKEEFNVEPLQLPNAEATVAITVYSLVDGSVLQTSEDQIPAGSDGTIAAQDKTYSAPSIAGYLPAASQTIHIPAVGKGQKVYVPVSFYLQSELNAAEAPTIIVKESAPATPEKARPTSVTNPDKYEQAMDTYFNAYTGQKVENLDEVNQYIDQNLPAAKAYTPANIKSILKAVIKSLNTGFSVEAVPVTINVPGNSTVTLKPTTKMNKTTCDITTTIEDVSYTIPNVIITKAGTTSYEETTVNHDGHDGHDGHGNNGNAGGGAGGK